MKAFFLFSLTLSLIFSHSGAGVFTVNQSMYISEGDTLPIRIPLSKNPYYPDREVPSEEDGYIITGGRFDEFDMSNIVYHYIRNPDPNNLNNVLVRIDFFDMDNRLRGSYDVSANNPYKPEMYKPFLSEAYLSADVSILDRREYPDYDWKDDVRQYATAFMVGGITPCETVALAYYLQALSEDRTLLGVVATFVLLDNTGKEIARFEDLDDVFFGQGIVTCDQKYFCLQYGGEFTLKGGRMYNDRFRIYDVGTKEVIYDWELPEDHQFSGPTESPGGWVRIGQQIAYKEVIEKGYTTSQIQYAFDIKNHMKYTSPIDVRLNYVRSFTEDGFIIQDQETKAFHRIRYQDWPSEKF
jgi:hypothetical protein